MKKSNLKYFLIATVAVLGIVAVSVYSCEKQEFVPNTTEATSDDPTRFITEPGAVCGEMIEKSIVRQDGKTIGQALMYNDTKYFYVIMTSNKGFLLGNCYMHVSNAAKEIPADKGGNPLLDMYKYTIDSKPSSTMRKFRIPVSDLDGNNIISVAVLSETSTTRPTRPLYAWIEGQIMGDQSKGRSFAYARQICKTDASESNIVDK